MFSDLLVPLGLLFLGMFLLVIEVFLPSAGLLGICAAVALLSSVVLAFYQCGTGVGTVFFGVALVATGSTIFTLVKWWPHTPLGKLILVEPEPAEGATPTKLSQLKSLIGEIGQATVVMLPGGLVRIGGKNYDAVTDGAVIEKGTWVEVVALRGLNLIVRPITEEVRRARATRADDSAAGPPEAEVLEDPFADPLP